MKKFLINTYNNVGSRNKNINRKLVRLINFIITKSKRTSKKKQNI